MVDHLNVGSTIQCLVMMRKSPFRILFTLAYCWPMWDEKRIRSTIKSSFKQGFDWWVGHRSTIFWKNHSVGHTKVPMPTECSKRYGKLTACDRMAVTFPDEEDSSKESFLSCPYLHLVRILCHRNLTFLFLWHMEAESTSRSIPVTCGPWGTQLEEDLDYDSWVLVFGSGIISYVKVFLRITYFLKIMSSKLSNS